MKKGIIILVLSVFTLAVIFTSCNRAEREKSCEDQTSCIKVNSDSLIQLWNNAWNTKNLEAFKGMIADNAIAIDKEWKVEGRDSIMSNWITKNLPVISNVKTELLHECNCFCCVSLTGFYTLDVTTKEGLKTEKGNFTFIWKLQDDKSYKLEVMHMTQL